MNNYVEQLESLLYDAIVELEYIRCVESPGDHSLCATRKGRVIVELGMKLLNVKDLAFETWKEVHK